MNKRLHSSIAVLGLALLTLVGFRRAALAAFTSLFKAPPITASANVVSGTSLAQLSIVASPLPASAFFGKNIIIPVQVIATPGPIDAKTLLVRFIYVLLSPTGAVLTPPISVTVTLVASPDNGNALIGSVLVPAADLTAIQHGGSIKYIFEAVQGGNATILNTQGISLAPAPDPASAFGTPSAIQFETVINNTICAPVGPSGAVVSAPDLFEHDGQTSVSLAAGAVASAGTLCITQEDTSGWPAGPSSTLPAVVYTITLADTTLQNTAGLTLSYPADVNGRVLNLNINPQDLGIYWLGPEGLPLSNQSWHVLSRSQLDSTRHTVTGISTHFSTFALFPAGVLSTAASIRPSARIITPNGDGINDTITFTGLVQGQDDARIFDVRGRRVRHLTAPLAQCAGAFCWDGKDDGGGIVESGVYLYQYTSQGERVSGVVAVAK